MSLIDYNQVEHTGYNKTSANGNPVVAAAFKTGVPTNLQHEKVKEVTDDMQEEGFNFWKAESRNGRLYVEYTRE